MKHVHELMKTELLTHTPDETLRDAEQTMGEHKIRHLPIVDGDGHLVGLMSQKEFLAEAFKITDKFGAHHLQEYLAKTTIDKCMQTELHTVKADSLLKDAAELIRSNRHQGCALVVDDSNKLVGLLTSQDFVKLAAELLG